MDITHLRKMAARDTGERVDINSIPPALKFAIAYTLAINGGISSIYGTHDADEENVEEARLNNSQTQDFAGLAEPNDSIEECLDESSVPHSLTTIRFKQESKGKSSSESTGIDILSYSLAAQNTYNDIQNVSQDSENISQSLQEKPDIHRRVEKKRNLKMNERNRDAFLKVLRPREKEGHVERAAHSVSMSGKRPAMKKLKSIASKRKRAENAFSDSSPNVSAFKEGVLFKNRCSIEFWKMLIKMQCEWLKSNSTKNAYNAADKGFILNCWHLITRHYLTMQKVSSDVQKAATVFLSNCIKIFELAINHGYPEISTLPIEFVQKIVKKFFMNPRWMDKYNITWVYVREAFHIIMEHPTSMETLLSLYAAFIDNQTRVINTFTSAIDHSGKRSAEMKKNFLCFVIGEISSFVTVLNQRIQQKNRAVTFNLQF